MTRAIDGGAWSRAAEPADGVDAPTSAHVPPDRSVPFLVSAPGPTTESRTDELRLVARLRAGEASAVEELYDTYRKPISGFLFRLARDKHVAEDLFQNTWLKVSRGAPRLREDTDLKAWVFTVARNEFRSYRRWRMIDLSRVFVPHREPEELAGVPTDSSDSSLELAAIERAMASLGAADREVLLLVCVEGMDPQRAAMVLDISHAALRQRLGRARNRLKEVVTELETPRARGRDGRGQ